MYTAYPPFHSQTIWLELQKISRILPQRRPTIHCDSSRPLCSDWLVLRMCGCVRAPAPSLSILAQIPFLECPSQDSF